MSLTPPPPPPPHRPSSLLPSGCKTPILNPSTRRLSTATGSSSGSVPSPNQLRQILADITKQVTNSPQSRIPSHHHHANDNARNTFMRPSLRQTGPVTRSRSMLRHITPRSSITPRGTRSNTPVRDENLQSDPLVIQSPRTPFNIPSNSPSSRSILGGGSPSSTQNSSRHPIAPLRYRTLSSVSSLTNGLASPTTTTTTTTTTSSGQRSHHPTPSSSTSSNLRSSLRFGGSRRSSPTPPLTPSSSSNSHTTSNLSDTTSVQFSTTRERRSLDQVESPSSDQNLCPDSLALNSSQSTGSLAKRRRRNPSGLGRL